MNDTFSDTGKAFELAQGGSAAFELQEYLLLGGIVKQLEGATVSSACFCFVFAPAAIFIVFYLSNNTSFDWVLVNVTEQGEW